MDRKYTLVIAEDEELLLNNLENRIYSYNLGLHISGKAQTGEEALKLIEQHSPHILVTDIRMPVMDGIALLSRVSTSHPSLKSIILSGYSDFEYAKEAIKYGVNEYLLKPVNNDELKEALFKIITQLDLEEKSFNEELALPVFSSREETASVLNEYIRANYDKNINLEELISRTNYSPNYVTRIFSSIYGLTPVKYMISLRVHRAQHLLVHKPELTLQDIGELVGYSDVSYFSRIFKKYTGTSPGSYREEERKRITSSREQLFPL